MNISLLIIDSIFEMASQFKSSLKRKCQLQKCEIPGWHVIYFSYSYHWDCNCLGLSWCSLFRKLQMILKIRTTFNFTSFIVTWNTVKQKVLNTVYDKTYWRLIGYSKLKVRFRLIIFMPEMNIDGFKTRQPYCKIQWTEYFRLHLLSQICEKLDVSLSHSNMYGIHI